jgi:hypothetical protein
VNEEQVDHKGERAGNVAARELGDEEIDLLVERSPTLIAQCRLIHGRMEQGEYLTHEQMLAALDESPEA